jgi:diaminopimelate epimerase
VNLGDKVQAMDVNFQKMHGLGNDFVIIDGRKSLIELTDGQKRQVSDRKRGVGCDQLIVIAPSTSATAYMHIYNPDGSEAGACGNATRCVADILMKEAKTTSCVIETVSGLLSCDALSVGRVRVNMGPPRLNWQQIPLSVEADTLHLPLEGEPVAVSMGNPHCVFFCGNAEDTPVDKLGPKVEHDPLFPNRTNVEFVSMMDRQNMRMRVWERGAGITEACGSGACAAAVAAIRRGLADPSVSVHLDGGVLEISWNGEASPVFMTGEVAYSFNGRISLS